ncbi:MAG: gamma-glutamylcyclotransferase family protein [Rhodomicrobiaceae bacterium]
MPSFIYFAYGSNMLSTRLRERCPSAEPLGLGWISGYSVVFDKEGRDGSGKATLRPDARADAAVHGVLYRVAQAEREALDRAEARYDRLDDFAVTTGLGESPILASVYIAPPKACRSNLAPFDWYVALIESGAREHDLHPDYIGRLCGIEAAPDHDAARSALMNELAKIKRL